MKLNYTKTMKKFSLLMAAIASLFLMGCQKSNYYENAIIGSWESYSRSRTLLKNGAPVSAETYIRDLIEVGELEEPENAEEWKEILDEARSSIYQEYIIKGDEDITLTFEQDGKFTSVYYDEEPETQTSTYSIQGDKLFIETPDDPSILMRVNIVKITESELVISTVVKETIWIEEPLVPLGYSTLNQIRFTKK